MSLSGDAATREATRLVSDLRHRSDAARIALLEAELEALRAEVAQARLILEGASEHAIIVLNLGGRIVGWNAGATNLLGYAREDAMGRSGEMVLTPEDRAEGRFVTKLCLALDHGRAVTERAHVRQDGSRFWASGVMLPLRDGAGGTTGFLTILCDRSPQQREAERRGLLQDEAQHRMRNLLTVVQALASRTARQAATPEAFHLAFDDQIRALARSCDAGVAVPPQGAWLHEVLGTAVSAFGTDAGRIRVQDGAALPLSANAAAMLGLVLHELGVNAAKHGALSTAAGRVEIRWTAGAGVDGPDLVWREHDGPLVRPPARRGAGTRLLEGGLARQFGGSVQLRFEPAGLECHVTLPGAADAG